MQSDPIADMLTRIRNAMAVLHPETTMPSSKLKQEVARILSQEGYIDGYTVEDGRVGENLTIRLRYNEERVPALTGLNRISKPGLRVYKGATEVPSVRGGIGVAIVSTSDGVMTDREARRRNVGGEILCEVW
jgi:small subunit ribosomal protein S8